MFGFLGKILGGKTVEKGLDLADKVFYTEQEKAHTDLELAKAYGQNSPASSKARRFMMYLFCVPFMLCFLTGFVHLLLGNSAEINNIINYVNLWNLPALVGGILLFYFGRQAMAEAQSNKRIANLALLKKEEAKIADLPKSKNDKVLENMIKKHEGLRLKPYRCTAGKLTVGIGRNLDDRGISEDEANYLLQNDITLCKIDLDENVGWWRKLNKNRQRVLIDMCFNLGIARLLQFKKFLQFLQKGEWEKASSEMLDSRWAKQVGVRADELSRIVETGGL